MAAAVQSDWDVVLGGKGFMIVPGSFSRNPLPMSFTQIKKKDDQDTVYNLFDASVWTGDGLEDWLDDGPFRDGYGLDLTRLGSVKNAPALTKQQTDTANPAGYIGFSIVGSYAVLIGKTDGKAYRSSDAITFTNTATLTAAAVSWGTFQGRYYIGEANGDVVYTTDGNTFTASGITKPNSNPAYILGGYRGKLFIAWNNELRMYDGVNAVPSTFNTTTTPAASTLDCTNAIAGAVGKGGLWFVTQGPAKVYFTDGNQLYQPGEFTTDFEPWDITVHGDLLVWGGTKTTSGGMTGEVHRLGTDAFEMIKAFGELSETNDKGIRCAMQIQGDLWYGMNRSDYARSGVGRYDATLDIYADFQAGFYMSSSESADLGTVWGICQIAGKVVCGVAGKGIFAQGTVSDMRVEGALFSQDKHIGKLCRYAEIRCKPLTTGQQYLLELSKGDGSWTTVLTMAYDSVTAANNSYRAAVTTFNEHTFAYRLTGTANGATLELTNVCIRYIQIPDKTKFAWSFVVAVDGTADDPMGTAGDGTVADRGSLTMVADLDALWNTIATFIDPLSQISYSVIVINPRLISDDMTKDFDTAGANLTSIRGHYPVRLLQADL